MVEQNKIIGSICRCGHLQEEHEDSNVAIGHGECTICNCERFTWSKFLYNKGSD